MTRSQSTRRAPRNRIGTAFAVGLVASLGLTGCAAGQITQTSQIRPATEGITVDEGGTIVIVDAHLKAPPNSDTKGAYEAGDSASVNMLVVNRGQTEDEVTRIEIDGEEAELPGESTIPPQGALGFGNAGEESISVKLTAEYYPAEYLPITIELREAGEISFNIPVGTNQSELPRDPEQVADLHGGSGGGH